MKYRINSISVPFGGISWDQYTTEKDRIEYLFFYLESKRILTNPIEMELPDQCVHSVLEIKAELVNIAKDFDFSSNVKKELRQLIQICNKYLDNLNKLNLPHIIYKENDRWADLNFDSAMKQFRSGFKKSIENLSKETNVVVTFTIPEKW